jgi:hypothetical protein
MRYRMKGDGKAWTVTVEDGADVLVEAKAGDRKHATALVKQAAKDGWQSITAEALAEQTKAEKARENARIEADKKAAEPKKGKADK